MARFKSVVDGVVLPLGTGTAAAVIANQLPQNQKDSRTRKDAAKKLKKVEPNFSKSEGFNERVAQQAFDLVMKMDTETARFYTTTVVSDVLDEIIEKNLRSCQRHLDEVIAKRADQIRKTLVRTAIHKAEDTLPYAEALSKALTPYDMGYRFKESDFNRDPSSGQFRMKVKHTLDKPISDRQAPAIIGRENPKNLSGKDLARYQDEYRQLSGFLNAVEANLGGTGNANVVIHYRDRATKERWAEPLVGSRPPKKYMEDKNIEVLGAEARPETLHAGGAAFGLSTALGSSSYSPNASRAMSGATTGFKPFAESWVDSGPDADRLNSNAQTYRRLAAGSQYVGQVAPVGSKLQMAAAFGQFAGEFGPEAEKVVGPTARKTAYRYRGTERTPDPDLVKRYEAAIRDEKQRSVVERYSGSRGATGARRIVERPMGSGHIPVTQRAAAAAADQRAPSWEERGAGRGEIGQYLIGRLPNANRAVLQLASGNTPPSEGVMLNKNGQIVTQAVGYGDDHYLPFDLKHLSKLKGGEYIRTRSFGGLTSEDIYTGLMSGARRVTVVSHSGTFSVEFEPDFRGGRRYNDKARRMSRRYEQILDAVQSEQVDKTGIDPLIRADITRKVREENPGEDGASIRALIDAKVKEYKENPELTPEDENRIETLMRADRGADLTSRDAEQYRRQITTQILMDKNTKYRLDGFGYAEAQEALREQFPYYIKSDPHPVNLRTLTPDLHVDRGYVEPGRNRPTAAQVGLYGTKINQGIKRQGLAASTASHADYQERSAVRRGGTPDGGVPGSTEAVEGGSGEEPKALPAKDTIRAAIQKQTMRAASKDFLQMAVQRRAVAPQGEYAFAGLQGDALDAFLDNPANAVKVSQMADYLHQVATSSPDKIDPDVVESIRRYKIAAGAVGRPNFERSMTLKWTDNPPNFEEKAYQPGAPFEVKKAEFEKLNKYQSLLTDKPLSQMSDKEMKDEMTGLSAVYTTVKDVPGFWDSTEDGVAGRRELAGHISRGLLNNQYNTDAVRRLLEKPAKLEKRMQDIQRMRALKANLTPEETAALASSAPEQPKDVNVTFVAPGSPPAIGMRQQTDAAEMRRMALTNRAGTISEVLTVGDLPQGFTERKLTDLHDQAQAMAADALNLSEDDVKDFLRQTEPIREHRESRRRS